MSLEFTKIVLIVIFSAINISAFIAMLDDKSRSRRDTRRISESTLLFFAIAFGALGIFSGMLVARHKTRKLVFMLGVPLALIQNVIVIYMIYGFISC